jgi:hypothetical protein
MSEAKETRKRYCLFPTFYYANGLELEYTVAITFPLPINITVRLFLS